MADQPKKELEDLEEQGEQALRRALRDRAAPRDSLREVQESQGALQDAQERIRAAGEEGDEASAPEAG